MKKQEAIDTIGKEIDMGIFLSKQTLENFQQVKKEFLKSNDVTAPKITLKKVDELILFLAQCQNWSKKLTYFITVDTMMSEISRRLPQELQQKIAGKEVRELTQAERKLIDDALQTMNSEAYPLPVRSDFQ